MPLQNDCHTEKKKVENIVFSVPRKCGGGYIVRYMLFQWSPGAFDTRYEYGQHIVKLVTRLYHAHKVPIWYVLEIARQIIACAEILKARPFFCHKTDKK